MDKIDLRSDTVTWPTPEMREAMATAAVGDDVWGEDPTVKQLEAEAAELLGKEAGLLVTSGTQGNTASILTHCGRGDEIILGNKAHTFVFEAGAISALGGVHPHTVPIHDDGMMAMDNIRGAIRGDNEHFPRTRLVCLENTLNTAGGVALSKAYTDEVGALAHEHGLKLHIDGARIFNAAVALNIPARELVESADTVTFCLSKGLCAPVGSVLVGPQDFINEARRTRKMLGGGMRQAGIIAAAGLVAIHHMIDRLSEDHANACLLGEALEEIPGIEVTSVHTNFVFFDLAEDAPLTPEAFVEKLDQEFNVKLAPYPGRKRTFRAVTHYWITAERVREVTNAMRILLS